jgi:hypothetical protein
VVSLARKWKFCERTKIEILKRLCSHVLIVWGSLSWEPKGPENTVDVPIDCSC